MKKVRLFPSGGHDHRQCVTRTLKKAEEICRRRGARLTPLRRRVLELLCRSHKPAGAYDILEKLRKKGKAAPPTVYRALEFLLSHGLVHRVASLNAYASCLSPGRPHPGQLLICESCHDVAELNEPEIAEAIADRARRAGFTVRSQTVENLGLCPRCR